MDTVPVSLSSSVTRRGFLFSSQMITGSMRVDSALGLVNVLDVLDQDKLMQPLSFEHYFDSVQAVYSPPRNLTA